MIVKAILRSYSIKDVDGIEREVIRRAIPLGKEYTVDTDTIKKMKWHTEVDPGFHCHFHDKTIKALEKTGRWGMIPLGVLELPD